MSRIPPLPETALPDPLAAPFAAVAGAMGFVPNSLFALAHRPDILGPFLAFGRAVLGAPGDPLYTLKALATHVVSQAAGCRYCQAHTASTSHRNGVPAEKLAAVWAFETSPLFDARERAVLRVAFHAGVQPNAVSDADIAALRAHFTDGEAVEIMAALCLFGFLNRWNDSLATDLEPHPLAVAPGLVAGGWEPGKHRRTP